MPNRHQRPGRAPHLNAVIQEAMRLHPFLPIGGIRKTTDTGVTIRDVHIPPHTTVLTPLYTISRRESRPIPYLTDIKLTLKCHPGEDCFEQGSSFIPDRWTTRPEMVRNAAAHAPFSLGKYNCIGQHLAMRMMRYTLAPVIKKYSQSVTSREICFWFWKTYYQNLRTISLPS